MLATLHIGPLGFESFNNSQELTIMNFVSCFSRNHISQKVRYRVPLAQIIQNQLIQEPTNSIVGSISFNPDISFKIKMLDNQSFSKRLS